jgi:Tfp pilus assembly protein FimT
MSRGATLVELVLAIALLALLAAIGVPRARAALDYAAADAAAREITTALAVARQSAIRQGVRARLVIRADSLRTELWDGARWRPATRWPGPAAHRVSLQVSNPVVTYGPNGVGWGASNTTVRLRRGSQIETITTSRVGRVRRW